LPDDETREAEPEVLHHHAAQVAGRSDAGRVSEDIVYQRMEVARVRSGIVEAVGCEVRVAEAAQIGNDHLEAGGSERLDVASPDALRLRPAGHQEQRHAAAALAPVGELEKATDSRAFELHSTRVIACSRATCRGGGVGPRDPIPTGISRTAADQSAGASSGRLARRSLTAGRCDDSPRPAVITGSGYPAASRVHLRRRIRTRRALAADAPSVVGSHRW